jgi:predicted SnoaL-like aldol condensation-catalyzing enzyme
MTDNPAELAANKQLVLDYFHDVVASFDLRPLSDFIAEDFILHGADDLVGIDAFDRILQRDFDGQPPLDPAQVRMFPPAFTVAEGDLVTIVFYMPMAVPGDSSKAYDYYGFNTYRIVDGKIAERWTNEHRYARPQFLPEAVAGKDPTAPGHLGQTDLAANKRLAAAAFAQQYGPVTPAVLQAEGDIVVVAAEFPQPLRDGDTGTWNYYAYEAYRVRDGELTERWSGIDEYARPELS